MRGPDLAEPNKNFSITGMNNFEHLTRDEQYSVLDTYLAVGLVRKEVFAVHVLACVMKMPVLTGSTKFTPLPDVKNIMITGGAGFMFA